MQLSNPTPHNFVLVSDLKFMNCDWSHYQITHGDLVPNLVVGIDFLPQMDIRWICCELYPVYQPVRELGSNISYFLKTTNGFRNETLVSVV